MIRVDRKRLAYMAVPKAACSSVKAALASIDLTHDGTDATEFGQAEVHRIYQTQRFRLHRWKRVQDYFRFTVVRDPLKRLLAVYTNRVVGFGDLHNSRNIRRGRVALTADPDPDYFFQNLDAYIAASSSIKHHALPTAIFTGNDLSLYSRVYRTSDIPSLQDELSTLAGRDVTVPHINATHMPLTLDDLSCETHRVLAARLEGEYDHLRDYFRNPFTASASRVGR